MKMFEIVLKIKQISKIGAIICSQTARYAGSKAVPHNATGITQFLVSVNQVL